MISAVSAPAIRRVSALVAFMLVGGIACGVVFVARFPHWQTGFLLIPTALLLLALAALTLGIHLARFPAAAGLGYVLAALATWLAHVPVYDCVRPYGALDQCSWEPDRAARSVLMLLLVTSVLTFLIAIGRSRDWLAWAVAGAFVAAFGVVVFGKGIPGAVVMLVAMSAAVGGAAVLGWRWSRWPAPAGGLRA